MDNNRSKLYIFSIRAMKMSIFTNTAIYDECLEKYFSVHLCFFFIKVTLILLKVTYFKQNYFFCDKTEHTRINCTIQLNSNGKLETLTVMTWKSLLVLARWEHKYVRIHYHSEGKWEKRRFSLPASKLYACGKLEHWKFSTFLWFFLTHFVFPQNSRYFDVFHMSRKLK